MSDSVLILGANGRFGNALAHAFDAAGWQVLAQARRPLTHAAGTRIRAISVGLDEVDAIVDASRGAALVVHALNPPYTQWSAHAMPLAERAMDLAQRLDALLLFPGNVYNFGTPMPALLDESTLQRPSARKGVIRVQIEQAMRARAMHGLRSVVVRAGDFFGGPGRGSWFDLVIAKDLARGRVTWPGPLDRMHAWAYLPDLASACVALAQVRDRFDAFEALHFPGHALTGAAFIEALDGAARRAGLLANDQKLARRSLPWGAMRLVAPLVPMWREIAEMRYLWTDAHALAGERWAQRVGPLMSTPIDDALDVALIDLGLASAGVNANTGRVGRMQHQPRD